MALYTVQILPKTFTKKNKQTSKQLAIKSAQNATIACFGDLYKPVRDKLAVEQNMEFAREVQCSAAGWNIETSRQTAV